VTVTVRGNDYYINNAKIIASNQILENGVAHVIDQVGSSFETDTLTTDRAIGYRAVNPSSNHLCWLCFIDEGWADKIYWIRHYSSCHWAFDVGVN
jgi:hypothetical protein